MSAITLINMTNATLISRDAATVTGSMDVVRPNQYGCCKPSITFFQLKCSCITIIIIHSSYLIAYNISCEYTKKKCFKTYVSWSSFFFRDHAVACFSLSRIKLKQSSCRTLQTGHAIVTTGYQNVSQKDRPSPPSETRTTGYRKKATGGGTLKPGKQKTKMTATGRLPSHSIEGSSIPFLPKQPANQEDQGVETPPQRFMV